MDFFQIISCPEVILSAKEKVSKRENSAVELKTTFAEELEKTEVPEMNIIYTDGSKMENRVFMAVYHHNCTQSKWRLRLNLTPFDAEIFAVYKALKYIRQNH